ncbi:MAG TPA: hypothetical protein VFX30_14350 [bacterium]|nr:hypothetical protein [bacterium]
MPLIPSPSLSPALLAGFRPSSIDRISPSQPGVYFDAPGAGTSVVHVGRDVPAPVIDLLRFIRDEAERGRKRKGVETSYREGGIGPKWSLRPERAEAGCLQAKIVLGGVEMVYGGRPLWMPNQLEIRRSRASFEGLFTAVQCLTFLPGSDAPTCRAESGRRTLTMKGFDNAAMKQLSWESLSKDPAFEGWLKSTDRFGGALHNRAGGEHLRVTRDAQRLTVEWRLTVSPLPEAVRSRWDFVLE